jgi:hypothetical protein
VIGSPSSTGNTSYAFKNVQYNTYIALIYPPSGYNYLSQTRTPCPFYPLKFNGGYLEVLISVGFKVLIIAHWPYRFSPDPGLNTTFWHVPDEPDMVGLEAASSMLI